MSTDRRVEIGDRIQGVITQTGGAGGRDGPELIVKLRPWLDARGAVQRAGLRVVVPMRSDREVREAMRHWQGKTVSLAVHTVFPATTRMPDSATADALEPVDPHPSLRLAIEECAKPRLVQHSVLGELRLDRDFGVFEGTRQMGSRKYDLAVGVSEPDDDTRVGQDVERASAIVQRVEADLPRIRSAMADKLFALYERTWPGAGNLLSRSEFAERPALSSIHVTDTRVTVYFSAEDIFEDHVIEVRMSPECEIREICVSG